ncbi:MAG TPA: CpaD family pilus assembly lipoprotein [Hyphomicrobiaceae bacterium]|nr:CpaD family pilus assembly lipoprotein [Hyphomicrobiaceae bacterium]
MLYAAQSFRALSVAAASAAIVASLALAACEDHHRPRLPDFMGVALNDVDARHPIGFVDRREVLNVDAPPRGRDLSHNQSADLYRFVARYKAEGVGQLAISVPKQNDVGTSQVVAELGRILREAEIAPQRVVRTRHADGRLRPAVRLSYATPEAIGPECGHWHRDVARDPERLNYPEFGCATQRNLAGMVANSRDLQRPQDEQPRSSERRSQTWSKYIEPERSDTAATKVKAEETTKK